MSKKMDWNFILSDRCPSCHGPLSHPNMFGKIECLNSPCTFSIYASRFKELVQSMVVRIR